MSTVVRLRRSTMIIILMIIFGLMSLLALGYADLRSLHDFDSRRDYDICIGANNRVERIVEKLTERTEPERRDQFLAIVREADRDCDAYKIKP